MLQETIKRTAAEKERIGDAMIFLAMLGPLKITGRDRLDSIETALALLADSRLVPVWWDQLPPNNQLAMVQMLGLPAGGSCLVMDQFRFMVPKIQAAFTQKLRQKCRESIMLAARGGRELLAELQKLEGVPH